MKYTDDKDDIDLYEIIENLNKQNAPIILRGGTALSAALNEHNAQSIRKTIDIDMSWTDNTTSPEDLQKELESAVQRSYPDYTVKQSRSFTDEQTYGFQVIDQDGIKVTKFDIDMNQIEPDDTRSYKNDKTSFTGISVEHMMADKISALSSPMALRRSKDLFDAYAILQYIPFDHEKVIKNLIDTEKLGDFDTFDNNKEGLHHSYDRLHGITNKPEFETAYKKVSMFREELQNQMQTSDTKQKYSFNVNNVQTASNGQKLIPAGISRNNSQGWIVLNDTDIHINPTNLHQTVNISIDQNYKIAYFDENKKLTSTQTVSGLDIKNTQQELLRQSNKIRANRIMQHTIDMNIQEDTKDNPDLK